MVLAKDCLRMEVADEAGSAESWEDDRDATFASVDPIDVAGGMHASAAIAFRKGRRKPKNVPCDVEKKEYRRCVGMGLATASPDLRFCWDSSSWTASPSGDGDLPLTLR